MKIFRHIALVLTALLIASCAIDEMWDGVHDAEGEEVVMTFKPKFEDFESVTKAIGDGSKVDKLLVQVYAEGADSPDSYEYNKADWNKIKISFFYGKTYKVYFWAYAKSHNAYEIAEGGLKNGVTVNYPENTDALGHDALEYLDAFYAVETINLSDDIADNTKPSLTRPFAQVNLVADKAELETAKATKVEFTIDAADSFVPGGEALSSQSRTFTFKDEDFFKNNEEISEGKVYLGTTYLFVPSSGSLEAKVTLYDSMDNKLKGPSTVTIPLASNQRTNLVFTGVEPAWDDDAMDVPAASDGWIHIETPEQMAAFLLEGLAEGAKVHVCLDINMGGLPQKYHEAIAARTFTDLTLYGGALENGNPVGGGSHMISNFTAPAFLANAAGLTVSDLVLDNFKVEGNGHVGTLVNTLKGSSTFTNVTVSNSSATTSNGAAGGVVGYIERIAPTDRSEVMEVAFYNCMVNGAADKPVATGSLAEGKFVGLLSGYDNGEKLLFTDCSADANTKVDDYASRYVEGNESAWQSGNDYSAYSGFLGDEKYLRAKVYFGGEDEATNRFCPKWDGTTNTTNLDIEPLLANATYDSGTTAGTNRFVVYSAFDLAGVRKKTASPAAVYLMNHIDMFGQGDDGVAASPKPNRPSVEISDDNLFNPFEKVSYLDGMNFTIHNLSVEQVHNTNLGGTAFIRMASGETTHQNLTLSNPDIKAYSTDPISDGNAYAGTLVSTVTGKYSASNIQILGGNVFAICKMGGLYGRISGCSSFNISNCIVDGITLRNYDSGYNEVFLDTTLMGIRFLVQFHSDGEVGGLIGFITGSDAVISDCQVKNSNIYCTGENDWEAEALIAKAQVPGRHVNSFIGDVRTTRGETISISRYTLKNNNLHKSEGYAENKYKEFRRYSWNSKSWECFGFVYAVTVKFNDVPGTVKVDDKSVHVSQSIVTAMDKSIN